MVKSLSDLLMWVNHALVIVFKVANMYFKTILENKILLQISEFTVASTSLAYAFIQTNRKGENRLFSHTGQW